MLTVSGIDLLGLTAQRITIPPYFDGQTGTLGFDIAQGSSETLIKYFVSGNMITANSEPRRIPGLELAPDLNRGTADDKYMTRHDVLADVLTRISSDAALGMTVDLDPEGGRFIFDVREGTDRTVSQRDVPPVVVSINRKTALSVQHTDSDMGIQGIFSSRSLLLFSCFYYITLNAICPHLKNG